jgi:AcrR family transcriptional regulator
MQSRYFTSVDITRAGTTERIFAAAGALLADDGIGAFTISRVAEAAGLGRATVYNHFRSRDELVLRLLQRSMDDASVGGQMTTDCRQRVVAVAWSMIVAFSQTIGSPAASMSALTAPDPELHHLQASIAAEMTSRFRVALDVGTDELVAIALVWATIGLLLQAGYGQIEVEDLEGRIESVADVVLAGVA